MSVKRIILGILMLLMVPSIDTAYAQTLCGIVRSRSSGGPVVGAVITLSTLIANTAQGGSFCFGGISPGKYQIVIHWQGNTYPCSITTGNQNICDVP
jgi:hypothetical protein